MPSTFQEIILKLQTYWAVHGCLIGQPYYTQVGAGTMNPATFLRVLGPEPWNVAYVEPSVRPDDGRYGENPNRFQLHYQFQVILKPDPGNPVELYLQSLEALGIDPRKHDIRLVEDNWEQPAISAWGLGWEIWLDGQEITQFTYFQQVGGQRLDPVAVEITYGLDRILIALNNADAIWNEPWGPGVPYGEVRRREEFEHSTYYFDVADVDRVRRMYELYEQEAESCLAHGLVLPAYDYVLKCSHAFNTLDTRGAISLTERQAFFGRMRDLSRRVAEAYLEQRKQAGYPLLPAPSPAPAAALAPEIHVAEPLPFVLEVGVEEMPPADLESALEQLRERVPALLDELRLEHGAVEVYGTPRRLIVAVAALAPRQPDREELVRGPAADKAFKDGQPTAAALGFARSKGLDVKDLQIRELEGGRYVFGLVRTPGRPTPEVLMEALPGLIGGLGFVRSMRWLPSSREGENLAFSRPIRWLVALLGPHVIPFRFAGLIAGDRSRGLRPFGSPEFRIESAQAYFDALRAQGILYDPAERRAWIENQARDAAKRVGGEAMLEPGLLAEVANLVERPTALVGSFKEEYLSLPRDVLIGVMKKHQRYFPVLLRSPEGKGCGGEAPLSRYFIVIRNGDDQHLDLVRQGNEHVLGARFADASFFVREDLKHPLEFYRGKLGRLVFQTKLGSMADKADRVEQLTRRLVAPLGLSPAESEAALRAAHLCKADLATRMVVEMTSLQGLIGREYALRAGEPPEVAGAIGEHYLPVPRTRPGLAVAMADRLDSLIGLFAVGLAPTGARDPFGLRRAALGVVQPLVEHDLPFDLRAALAAAAALQPVSADAQVQAQVLEFIAGRLRAWLLDQGFRYDVVDAVLAVQAHDPASAARAVRSLAGWVARPEWSTLLPGFARCVRITRDQTQTYAVDEALFREPEERALFAALRQAESAPRAPGAVDDFLHTFAPMVPAVDRFFEKVLVMAEDRALRENRLGLLQRIAALSSGVADLSRLEGF